MKDFDKTLQEINSNRKKLKSMFFMHQDNFANLLEEQQPKIAALFTEQQEIMSDNSLDDKEKIQKLDKVSGKLQKRLKDFVKAQKKKDEFPELSEDGLKDCRSILNIRRGQKPMIEKVLKKQEQQAQKIIQILEEETED
ncbi:MAG: hypothetical protein GF308_07155 [Candidatus Heimdallarchaeota archaeon]|nr:hypothetical protein [Candidatus Heimdallarchaeota archaeon]